MPSGISQKSCDENKKTQHLEYDKLNESPYLTVLFFDIKVNFNDKCSPDLSYTICKEGGKTLEHILQCYRPPACKARETVKVDSLVNRYVVEPLKSWGKFLKFYLTMKESFSE